MYTDALNCFGKEHIMRLTTRTLMSPQQLQGRHSTEYVIYVLSRTFHKHEFFQLGKERTTSLSFRTYYTYTLQIDIKNTCLLPVLGTESHIE